MSSKKNKTIKASEKCLVFHVLTEKYDFDRKFTHCINKKKNVKDGNKRKKKEKKILPTIISKVQRVLDHMVVIPHVQQVVSGVVIHSCDVLVGVGKWYV